ncbi:hypothetical protein PoB_007003000 [Plakobranchus ocellatus]|uniref:Uncharacterized protein n=1 Tax=Plakobranchus ocellatus TaxID=259542 RepID=A0AAV4DHB1_9GAST|nr:hypothetical protein PoB_007003000 [Plakobranchus ocellatus]
MIRPSPHQAWSRSGEVPVMVVWRYARLVAKHTAYGGVWDTKNFTACSKRPGTSLKRSSGESPRLGRCVQVEKTKRLDWCAAITSALPPQPYGRCGRGLRLRSGLTYV